MFKWTPVILVVCSLSAQGCRTSGNQDSQVMSQSVSQADQGMKVGFKDESMIPLSVKQVITQAVSDSCKEGLEADKVSSYHAFVGEESVEIWDSPEHKQVRLHKVTAFLRWGSFDDDVDTIRLEILEYQNSDKMPSLHKMNAEGRYCR